jgi:hypothetical protein
MGNEFPTNSGEIYNLATKNYDGIVAIGAAIPVTMLSAPQLLTSKTAFMNAETAFNTARNTQRNAYLVFKPAMSALYDWLVGARAVLTLQLGDQWSAAWAEAGFVAPSTAVPRSAEGRIALGRSLAIYFTDHPTAERPDDDVTAAKATELTDAALAGQNGVATAKQTLRNADGARRPARKDVLYLMSTLVSNLNKKLAANDPRWLAFGLQMPSTPTTPGAPVNVTAMLAEDGAIIVQCDPVPLATRYRGRMLIAGVETKYQLVFSGPEPMGRITGVQPGVTVQIIVQAVNGSSQSMPSDPVLFTMPLAEAEARATALAEEMAPLVAIAPNGNGSANGNGVVLTAARN